MSVARWIWKMSMVGDSFPKERLILLYCEKPSSCVWLESPQVLITLCLFCVMELLLFPYRPEGLTMHHMPFLDHIPSTVTSVSLGTMLLRIVTEGRNLLWWEGECGSYCIMLCMTAASCPIPGQPMDHFPWCWRAGGSYLLQPLEGLYLLFFRGEYGCG